MPIKADPLMYDYRKCIQALDEQLQYAEKLLTQYRKVAVFDAYVTGPHAEKANAAREKLIGFGERHHWDAEWTAERQWQNERLWYYLNGEVNS